MRCTSGSEGSTDRCWVHVVGFDSFGFHNRFRSARTIEGSHVPLLTEFAVAFFAGNLKSIVRKPLNYSAILDPILVLVRLSQITP